MSLLGRFFHRATRRSGPPLDVYAPGRAPPRAGPALPASRVTSLPGAGNGGDSGVGPGAGAALSPDAGGRQALRDAFTPTRPQRLANRLAGRQVELLRIFRAIALDRAHVVLYGERGRGKTSLVNLVASTSRNAGYMVGRYTCSVDSTFDDIIRGILRDLPRSMLATPVVGDELEGCEAAVPRGRIGPRDVASIPGRLVGRHVVMIADEFDRVEDEATRTMFADTIKQSSDRGAALSFLIVGVSDSLEELLGRHPSIQRNIVGLPLALLRQEDIAEILIAGGKQAGLEFTRPVIDAVCLVAAGVPYIAQLLGLHAGVEAAERHSQRVETHDLQAAFSRAVEEVDPKVAAMYQNITDGERDRAMLATLRNLASGEQDRFARFVIRDGGRTRRAGERSIDPDAWARLVAAGLVRPCPSVGPDTFAFAEPMLQHYIVMRSLLDQTTGEERISA